MGALFSVEVLGAFLVCFSTLMIFSFLYQDNPFYKFAEHVFVGVSTGYGVVLVWFQILRPNLINRLLPPVDAVRQQLFRAGQLAPEAYPDHPVSLLERLAHGQFIYYVFLALGILMLFKISRKLHWLSRWPLAYVIGAFAGIQIIQAAQGALVPQLEATMKDFSGKETVVTAMESAGVLPQGEMGARRQAQVDWIADWLQALGEDSSRAAAAGLAWQGELEQRLNGLAGLSDIEAPESRVREGFKAMRVGQAAVVGADAEFERLLCAGLGGMPVEESLPAPGQLPTTELAPWQDRLVLVATRVWLESPAGRAGLLEACGRYLDLAPAVAAEALAFPAGRPPLVQLLKSEGFPAERQPDWSLPVTRRLADSLLSEVNPRPVLLGEWKAEQVRNLLARLAPLDGGYRSELQAQLAIFAGLPDSARRAADAAFLSYWRAGVLRELRLLRQGWLRHTIALHTSPDRVTPYTRLQLDAFRRDPAGFLEPYGVTGSPTQMRVNMLVEILSNLLVVIGVCAGVFYFFFSKKHTGALGVVSKVGIAFLMMSFGASFGYTVMGRISLAIGRFQDLLAWPVMAGTALLVLIVALYLESRRARV